jgi:hypothetical protein
MGGESAEAWRAVLDDLIKRGLQRPEFLIVDGAPERAAGPWGNTSEAGPRTHCERSVFGPLFWAITIGCPKNASYELRNSGGCGRFVQGVTEIEAERGGKCKNATKAASHRRAALVGFKQRNVCFHNHRLQRFRRQHQRWRHAGKDGAFMRNHNSYLERGRQTRSCCHCPAFQSVLAHWRWRPR